MADVKWIKLTTDMFDNRKVKYLRKLPDGNNIVLIWVMLLTMAGRCNAGGMIFLTENVPYTPKMLADELDFEENTVILAIQALENLNMIETKNGFFAVAGWEEYQNTDRLAEIREYNRLAQQKSRAKKKLLLQSAVCQYCGGEATGYDHIVAKFNGGTDDDANLIPCCKKCNSSKRDKDVVQFLNMNIQEINLDVVCKNEKLAKFARFNGKYFTNVNDGHLTSQRCHDIEEEKEEDKEKEKEFHSFIQADGSEEKITSEEAQRRYLGGIGKGVVFLSNEQISDLLDKLSVEEFDRYIGIVADCELNGKPYKKKTHYQAILDMALKDRKSV